MTRTRRDVLAGGGTILSVALAGCQASRSEGTQTRSASTPATETSQTSTPATQTPRSPAPGWTKLNLTPTSLDEIVERAVRSRSSFDPEERMTLDRLAREGSVTVHNITRHAERPLHPPYLVELEGSIYVVDKQVVNSREVEVHRFKIEVLDASRADARAFADLSAVDQAIVQQGLTEEYRENGTPFTGTFFYKFESHSPTTSWIVATEGNVFVTYEGDPLRLRSMGSDTVVEQDLRYERTAVASTRSAAQAYVAQEYVRTISAEEIPPAQREILRAAITDPEGYREEGQGTEPFRAVLDRLGDVPQVPNDGKYIRYNGTVYQVAQTGVEV